MNGRWYQFRQRAVWRCIQIEILLCAPQCWMQILRRCLSGDPELTHPSYEVRVAASRAIGMAWGAAKEKDLYPRWCRFWRVVPEQKEKS